MILLDTNILLRYALATDPAFPAIDAALTALHARGEVLCIVPQNLYEFWAVATRPVTANGLGMTVLECEAQVARAKRLFRLLPDLPALLAEWEALVGTYQCHGRVSFDARLAAAMRTHGLSRLLTLNGADFARFPGITVIDPKAVAAAPPSTTP